MQRHSLCAEHQQVGSLVVVVISSGRADAPNRRVQPRALRNLDQPVFLVVIQALAPGPDLEQIQRAIAVVVEEREASPEALHDGRPERAGMWGEGPPEGRSLGRARGRPFSSGPRQEGGGRVGETCG